jgi:hypothetical protein
MISRVVRATGDSARVRVHFLSSFHNPTLGCTRLGLKLDYLSFPTLDSLLPFTGARMHICHSELGAGTMTRTATQSTSVGHITLTHAKGTE